MNRHDSRFFSGVLWSFASAFLWSTAFVAGRSLLDRGLIDPFTLTFVRFSIAGALLLAWGLLTLHKRMFRISRRDWLMLAGLGMAGVVGQSLLLFIGLSKTTAINGAMVMQLSPLMILLAGCLIRERIEVRNVAGLLVSLTGCLMVVEVLTSGGINYRPDHLAGDLYVLGGAACWTAYAIMGKPVVHRLGGFMTTTWAMVLAAFQMAFVWLVAPALGGPAHVIPVHADAWLLVAYIAVFPSAVAFLAFYMAMDRIPLGLLNVMQYLTPVFTIGLAWALLGESIAGMRLIGAVLVLGGVWISGRGPRKSNGTAS